MRIAFAGNPNSGKTTMYNALTGRNEKVCNWAGVTVDKKEALIKRTYAGDQELIAVDLPGAYSMSPFIPVANGILVFQSRNNLPRSWWLSIRRLYGRSMPSGMPAIRIRA